MTLTKQFILGVSITTSSKETILAYLSEKLRVRPRIPSVIHVVTPNPEQIMLAQKDGEFRRILNEADISLPDGAGVVWAMKRMSNDKCQMTNVKRIPGVDLMEDLCEIAAEKKWRVLFYGGREGVAKTALVQLQKQYPKLAGFTEEAPDFQISNFKLQMTHNSQIQNIQINAHSSVEEVTRHLIQTIRSKNIRVVFIGLGAPKQENLIDALRQNLTGVDSNVVLMAVGGTFDILAGKIKRAPNSVQKLGFEWLWRLFQEPWRWKRQTALVQFVWQIITSK